MRLLQMLQEGGWLAGVALVLGVIGTLFGVVGLMLGAMKARSAFGMGVTALTLATLAAGAGIAGTISGKRNVEAALAFVGSDVDRDHILRAGHREASNAALLGSWAAALPLVLGALGALMSARRGEPSPRRQGLEATVSTDETSSRSVVALVFAGIAALAASGAWVTGHRPPPPTKYDFADEDRDAWSLARSLEAVAKKDERGCVELAESLDLYWGATNRTEWPRQMKPMPPVLSGWRAAADGCAREQLAAGGALELLSSPLLQDEALHAEVVAKAAVPSTAAMNDDEKAAPETADQKARISAAIRKVKRQMSNCYERALRKQPSLEGKIDVHLTIRADGSVSDAHDVSETPFADAAVVQCVLAQARAVNFGPSPDGQSVEVRYPFVFQVAK